MAFDAPLIKENRTFELEMHHFGAHMHHIQTIYHKHEQTNIDDFHPRISPLLAH